MPVASVWAAELSQGNAAPMATVQRVCHSVI